jgi:TatA/E family protein of Tat protein translocase
MDFFGIGPLEILLIFVLALIIFGPHKLADIGKSLGKTVRSVRQAMSDVTTQVTKEIEDEKQKTAQVAERKET